MKKLILIAMMTLVPLASQALIEVRGGYGVNTPDDDDQLGFDVKAMRGLNADIIFEPPILTDLGIGLRYEIMSQDFNSGLGNAEADMDRLSLLVNYRIIDLLVYVGPIATLGLSTDYETTQGGVKTSWKEKTNYTLGIEAGVSLGLISLGAEVGKFFGKFENAGLEIEGDAIYAKAIVGFGF